LFTFEILTTLSVARLASHPSIRYRPPLDFLASAAPSSKLEDGRLNNTDN
jgi:hypothetical protein